MTLEPGVAKSTAAAPRYTTASISAMPAPLCVFDVPAGIWNGGGYDVRFVQNFTDIDDKIIRRANEEGVSSGEIAARYIAEYWIDAKGLGAREATVHPQGHGEHG